jgi:hypothetical protein
VRLCCVKMRGRVLESEGIKTEKLRKYIFLEGGGGRIGSCTNKRHLKKGLHPGAQVIMICACYRKPLSNHMPLLKCSKSNLFWELHWMQYI